MKYTVVWTKTAERKLAEIWLDADARIGVSNAARDIDRLLQSDPDEQGESREEGRRILLVPPLGAIYRVLPDDRLVRVLYVWRFEVATGRGSEEI